MARPKNARVLPLPGREEPWAYDVTLSFAGEDREYVERVAEELRTRGVRVFYDRFETVDLWGKDLFEHLVSIYRDAARYCVFFISAAYARKAWPTHERRSAYERAIAEHSEYVLPARFDDSEVPGLRGTIGYIDLREVPAEELVDLIQQKLGPRPKRIYLPPLPDKLFQALGAEDEDDEDRIYCHAWQLLDALRKMTPDERLIVNTLLLEGCPGELPDNLHMSMNVLKRDTGFSKPKITGVLRRITPLGFAVRFREGHEHEEADALRDAEKVVVLEWHDMTTTHGGNATLAAMTMLQLAIVDLCDQCAERALWDLDFSQLAAATASDDEHAAPAASA